MKKSFFVALVLLCSVGAQAAKEVLVRSKPVAATVFVSGGAAVNRTGTAQVAKGRTVLKIADLPQAIDFTTLRIKVSGGAVVMSVKTGLDMNRADQIAAMAACEKKIGECDSVSRRLDVQKEILKNRIELLIKNSNFGPQGLNDPNTQKAYEMYSREMESLKKAEYAVETQLGSLQSVRANSLRQLETLRNRPVEDKPYALVEIESNKDQELKLSVDYRVSDVVWFPSYDMRAEQGADRVDLVMKANIRQHSGEDWNGVNLRLSTAMGDEQAKAPIVSHYNLNYGTRPPVDRLPELPQSTLTGTKKGAVTGTVLFEEDRSPVVGATVTIVGTAVTVLTDAQGRFSINAPTPSTRIQVRYIGAKPLTHECVAGRNYTLVLEADQAVMEQVVVTAYGSLKDAGSVGSTFKEEEPQINLINTEQVHTQVALDIQVEGLSTVLSLPEPYAVDVQRHRLPIRYAYVSAPRVDPTAYLQMKVVGLDQLTLLDGELNMFFDNTLISSSILTKKMIADTTIFGINRDKRIQVRRTAVEDQPLHQIVGSKWVATRHWSYTVVNNTQAPIVLELSDRVPVSLNKEITVVTTHDMEPSSNKEGVLTWNVRLEPGQKQQFALKYVVSCPKGRTVYVD